jgi:hypothetical protein
MQTSVDINPDLDRVRDLLAEITDIAKQIRDVGYEIDDDYDWVDNPDDAYTAIYRVPPAIETLAAAQQRLNDIVAEIENLCDDDDDVAEIESDGGNAE